MTPEGFFNLLTLLMGMEARRTYDVNRVLFAVERLSTF
jgi:hypothetical protein